MSQMSPASAPAPSRIPRVTSHPFWAGAHIGAIAMASALAQLNGRSHSFGIEPIYGDVVPGRPEALVRKAHQSGYRAQARLGPVEQVDPTALAATDPFVLQVDRAGAAAVVLTRTIDLGCAVLTYLLLRFASTGDLFALAVTIPRNDEVYREVAARLLHLVDRLTPPTSWALVFGGAFAGQTPTLEPRVRQRLREHFEDVYVEVAVGVPHLRRFPFEVSRNGGPFTPLVPVDRTLGWATRPQLARRVAADAPLVLGAGTDFVIAESGPDRGFRLHAVTLDGGRDPEQAVEQAEAIPAGLRAAINTTD